MSKIVNKYCELPKPVRKPLWKIWHNVITKLDKDVSTVFMNYGYASENGEFKDLHLKPEDEFDRYAIQLYSHVATSDHCIKDKDVLEVGCGRGGGASFLTRYYKPSSYIGMDISKKTTEFCNEYHKVENLRFIQGEAEDIPFEDNSFDALINVESARCYGNIQTFFDEAYRVLKKDGKFLFADMIKKEDSDEIEQKIKKAGFKTVSKRNIRPNVVKALSLDSEQRKDVIDKRVPKFLQKSFYQFAGVSGTQRFEAFNSGEMGYKSYTLSKT